MHLAWYTPISRTEAVPLFGNCVHPTRPSRPRVSISRLAGAAPPPNPPPNPPPTIPAGIAPPLPAAAGAPPPAGSPLPPRPGPAVRAATVATVVHAAPSLDTFTWYPAPEAFDPNVTSTCFTGCTAPKSTCSHAFSPAASAVHSLAASPSNAWLALPPELAVAAFPRASFFGLGATTPFVRRPSDLPLRNSSAESPLV